MERERLEQPNTSDQNPMIGALINDRYRIIRVLGEGGMGTVYEAEHELLGRRLALKTLLPQLAKDPELVARFRREARAASTIGHDNIVDVTDMGSLEDGAPYIVMEMLAGRELADLIEEKAPLTTGRTVRIMLGVCSALSATHEAGIVHRDLKPANIFLVDRPDGGDLPKVLDFGISKMRGPDVDDQGLTNTGVAIGTPAYMSPEQAQGLKTVDHRTDVYAVGVILYQMLTGTKPFTAENYAGLLLRVMTMIPPPIGDFRADVPPELDAAIMRTIEKDPEDRFATIDELAAAIAPFAEIETPPELRNPPPETPQLLMPPSVRKSAHTDILPVTMHETPDAGPALSEPSIVIPQKRPPIALLAVIGLLGLAGVLGAGFLALGPNESDRGHAPEPVETQPTPEAPDPEPPDPVPGEPSAQIPPGTDEPSAAAPQEVRIQIRVVPGDAQIFIGETQFPCPLDAQQPRSLTPTNIRIERRGYRTIERVVIFDQDHSFDYEMSRGRGVDRRETSGGGGDTAPDDSTSPPATDEDIYRGNDRGLRDEF